MTGRDILCRNRQGFGIQSVKHKEKLSKGHENQRRITQGNELHRCWIR